MALSKSTHPKTPTWSALAPSRKTSILLVFSIVAIAGLLIQPLVASSVPWHLSAFTQGRIGNTILKLGSVSIHPISAVLTTQKPVCLVLVAVDMQGPAFGIPEGGVFLMGSQRRTYPATSITPLGQDAPFGQHKVRVFGFNPSELCAQGALKVEDLALLIVHPAGVGVVSFALPHTAQVTPSLEIQP